MRKDDIERDYLNVRNSYVLGVEKKSLKTAFRKRQINITEAIRKRLQELQNRPGPPHLCTMADDSRFNSSRFCKV